MAKTKKELEAENANLRQIILDLENREPVLVKKKLSTELKDFAVGIFEKDDKFHLAKIQFDGITEEIEIFDTKEVKIGGGRSIAVAEMERDNLLIEHKLGRKV